MSRWSLVLLTAVLSTATLAGCLSGDDDAADIDPWNGLLAPELRENLTEPIFGILGHFEHKFVGATGTQLYVDYYLPNVPADAKAPVILVFTPYQGAEDADLTDEVDGGTDAVELAYIPWLVEHYVPRGYAVAFADVRGNHQAGGCIDQTGPEQWQDGYDYVEWLGTQEWSSGKVGMYGVSYDAETQFTTAMMAPPHLATIVPIASVSNQYEWSFYNGVPYDFQPLIGMASYMLGSVFPSYEAEDALVYHEKLTCQHEAMAAGADFSGDHTEFWRERDYRGMADQIEASVLHVHGLADWNVRPIHIDPLFNDIRSEKRGIFGLWPHATPDREDWGTILHAWYDHFLMERDNGILDILPPVLIEDDKGDWHGIDTFPPVTQDWLELELSGDGTLVSPGNATTGSFTIRDYRTEVVADVIATPDGDSLGDIQEAQIGTPRSVFFEFLAQEELRLVGRPEVAFTATSDKVSTHWAARIEVVDDPRCEYEFRNRTFTQSVCINTGYQDTRHLEGMDQPADVSAGVPYDVTVVMYPQYDVIPAGATVRLHLANHDQETSQDTTDATSTIDVGAGSTVLRLPLAPESVPLPAHALPPIYPGYLVTMDG